MPRSPLTETVERVKGMVVHVRENLSLEEYDLFLDMVAPEPLPEVKKPQKKSSKKAAGGGGRSKRGESIKGQLSNRRQEQKVNAGACAFVLENGAACNTGDNNPIHDKTFGYAGYHEFQPPASSAAGSGG